MSFWSDKSISPARKYRFKVSPAGKDWWYVNSVNLPSFEVNTGEYQLLNQKFKYPGIPTWQDVEIDLVDVGSAFSEIKTYLASQGFTSLQTHGLAKGMSISVRQTIATQGSGSTTTANPKVEQKKQQTNGEAQNPDNSWWSGASSWWKKDKNLKEEEKKRTPNEAAEKAKQGVTQDDGNDMVIQQMTENGKTLRTWTLRNSFIKSVNYGELDYSSDDLLTMKITIGYDYATVS